MGANILMPCISDQSIILLLLNDSKAAGEQVFIQLLWLGGGRDWVLAIYQGSQPLSAEGSINNQQGHALSCFTIAPGRH
jgi:hypothetical protein